MGPGAKNGQIARVVAVGFDSLEDALGALQSPAFREIAAASEELAATHYLFECRGL